MKFRLHAIATLVTLAAAGLAHAQGAPAAATTRAAVIADFQQARAAGQLHRSDWYDEVAARPTPGSDETRKDVTAQARDARALRAKLPGPLRDRSYNPYQVEILAWRSDLHSRAEIRSEERMARAEGLLVPAGEAPLPMSSSVRRGALYAAN